MTLRFQFREERGAKGVRIRRPKIPVAFAGPAGRKAIWALVDPAADLTLVPEAVARFLGLELARRESAIVGIGGTLWGRESKVDLILPASEGELRLRGVPAFVPNAPSPHAVLGRSAVFEVLGVSFSMAQDTILFHRTDEPVTA